MMIRIGLDGNDWPHADVLAATIDRTTSTAVLEIKCFTENLPALGKPDVEGGGYTPLHRQLRGLLRARRFGQGLESGALAEKADSR
jgi:hypothetical protein